MELEQTLADQTGVSGSLPATGLPLDLPPGSVLGRYLVVAPIGAGAMGIVLAAYDPELDRKVAIKLLRRSVAHADDPIARSRMIREAQALAKLSHPHVVSVYDVGEHGGRVFLAMEFVPGTTLGGWLEAQPRTTNEILDMALAAGSGLVAAHDAGLIHRDFKPDNVMVGHDGRVRVMDFGLARSGEAATTISDVAAPSSVANRSKNALSSDLTSAGSLIGTPAYMSPEQFAGLEADAWTDQFGFCVTLWEALHGTRPFVGTNVATLAFSVTEGRIAAPPSGSRVPARLRRIVERGMATSREQRWPDMRTLLGVLSKERHRRPRVRALTVAGLLLTGAMGGGIAWERSHQNSQCLEVARDLGGEWGPETREATRSGLLASGSILAEATWSRVETAIDAWTERYRAVHSDECRHEGVGSDFTAAAMTCLGERRTALRAAVKILGRADADVAERALDLIAALPGPERCADIAFLSAKVRPPDDPEVETEVSSLRATLIEADALDLAGRYDEGLLLTKPVVERARELGYAPLLSQALLKLGRLQTSSGDYANAHTSLKDSFDAGIAGGDDDTAADAATSLVDVLGYRDGKSDLARLWAGHARALTERRGGDEEDEAWLLANLATVLWAEGNYAEARSNLERSIEIRTRLHGPDSTIVTAARNNLGNILFVQGELDAAKAELDVALASCESTFGPDHPLVASVQNNLGNVMWAKGDLVAARAHFDRALALYLATHGPKHGDVAEAYNNLGLVFQAEGQLEEAQANYGLSLSTFEAALGLEHPHLGYPLINLGNVLVEKNDLPAAKIAFDRAHKLIESQMGPEHPLLQHTLTGLGEVDLREGRTDQAVAELERALTIASATPGAPLDRATTEFTLARALAAQDTRAPRVRTLLESARNGLVAAGPAGLKLLAQLDAFVVPPR